MAGAGLGPAGAGTPPASGGWYGTGARAPQPTVDADVTAVIPAQRQSAGTVYSGSGGYLTIAGAAQGSVEQTGSLTGHILAHGWADTPTPTGNTKKVIMMLLAALGVLIAIGLLIVFVASDALGGLFSGLLQG